MRPPSDDSKRRVFLIEKKYDTGLTQPEKEELARLAEELAAKIRAGAPRSSDVIDGIGANATAKRDSEIARLKAENTRLVNERAALLAKLLIPDGRTPGGWIVMDRCGDQPSYRLFSNRVDAERFLFGPTREADGQ